jgi:alanyl aminopeptidase
VGQDADGATWDTMLSRLVSTEDPLSRGRLISAMALSRKPELAARARALALKAAPVLRREELLWGIGNQLGDPALRDEAWAWLKTHFDELFAKVKDEDHGGTWLLGLAGSLCDDTRADEVERFYAPRLAGIEGGARAAASAVESIRLCAALRTAQEPSARAFFAKSGP